MSKDKEKYFTMRIPFNLHTEIKAHCAKTNISMKDFCLKALLTALNVDITYLSSQVTPIYLPVIEEENEELDSMNSQNL